MLPLKIISLIIVYVVALIKDFWSDKLKGYVRSKQALLLLMTTAMIIGSASTVLDDQKPRDSAKLQLDRQAALQTLNDSLRWRVDSLIRLTQYGGLKFDQQNAILQARVYEVNSKFEPFIKIAVTKYPTFDIQTALIHLAKDVEEAKEMAKPITLTPSAKDVAISDGGLSLKLQFQPSKNAALGLLQFTASVPRGSKALITDFWPILDGGAFESGQTRRRSPQTVKVLS